MVGGSKSHLNINNGLSVPLGLALLNKQNDDGGYQILRNKHLHGRNLDGRNLDGGVLKEDIYSKLLSMAGDKKNTNSKTRKKKAGGKSRKSGKRKKTRKI